MVLSEISQNMGLKQCICTTAQMTCKFKTYREAPLVLWSDSALEVGFKGTVTFTLQKMLLSTEQQEDPTYTCIQWAIHEQRSKWPQKGSFATSGKIREMLCVRRVFLKALQVPKWIQMDPYLPYEHFSKRKPQTEPRPKQLNNFVMLSNTSMQQKLLRLFPAFPCSYWLPLPQQGMLD